LNIAFRPLHPADSKYSWPGAAPRTANTHGSKQFRSGLLSIQLVGIDKAMGDKGLRLLPGLLLLPPDMVTVMKGGITAFFLKENAERADAFKAHVIANFRYGKIITRQPLPRLFNPPLGKILVRRLLIDPGEETMKMKTGQTGFPRKKVQVDGLSKVFVDKDLGCYNLFIYVRSDGHKGRLKLLYSNLIIVRQSIAKCLLAYF
jgi:hypothetical protein